MIKEEIFRNMCLCGETSKVQFKEKFTSQKEIAKEMIAFANTKGGMILFGVEGKYFLICTVAEGKNKPYKNLNGEIWVKQGADKRRITENSEILALFQDSGSYQPDASEVEGTSFSDLDTYAIDDYFQKVYASSLEGFGSNAEQMLKNIHVLSDNGVPTIAGYLFFGKHPEYRCPTFMVKAVSFLGNDIAGTQFRDTKEILGNMTQLYDKSMAFLKSNLHNVQEEKTSFNTLGKLEIAEAVLEEILQNALVHRDLLRQAPVRIFIFDNRLEIISPGALSGGLTVDDIRKGKTYQRNPFMATFATNALHYRGIGSGIVRILAECPSIELYNDDDAKEFKVVVWRTAQKNKITTQKGEDTPQKNKITTQKGEDTPQKKLTTPQKKLTTTQKKVLDYLRENPKGTRADIADAIGNITEDGVKFVISRLQQEGLLERLGGRRYGEWKVL